jgi:hypothetical protein
MYISNKNVNELSRAKDKAQEIGIMSRLAGAMRRRVSESVWRKVFGFVEMDGTSHETIKFGNWMREIEKGHLF